MADKNQLAQSWSHIAPDFDQIGPPFFARSGQRLVELAGIGKGSRVLDVAAGRGAILFPAAEKVGGNGRITAIDLSPGMLKNTAADPRTAGLPISLARMDAERLAFTGSTFDIVLCGHAIFYFPQAVHEFYRVLRPGGQVGLTIIAEGTFDWLWQLFTVYLPPENPPGAGEPAINTLNGLHRLLHQARLEQIRVWEETAVFIYPDEETWWANLWAMGTRDTLETMSLAARRHIKTDLFQTLQDFKQPDGIHIQIQTIFALARKPEMGSNE